MSAELDAAKSALATFGQNIMSLIQDYKSFRDAHAGFQGQIDALTQSNAEKDAEIASLTSGLNDITNQIAAIDQARAEAQK